MTQFFNLKDSDEVAIRNSLNGAEIIQLITLKEVGNFLLSLGVDESDIDIQEDYLICPTICHNPLEEATSMKLYYYDKNKSFHCYTECSENFNIFELYRRYMRINHYEVSFADAEEYVRQFIHNVAATSINQPKKRETYHPVRKQSIIDLPAYREEVLDCFSNYHHPLWLTEGISGETMNKYGIGFSIDQNKITIPHRDYRGKLVGIRSRAISEEDLKFGKYRPMMVGDKMYNHQLGFNLYGLWENREAIKRNKQAIIVEGEKSVLLGDTFFSNNNIAVATCGSQLNKFQINLLTQKLGVNEIILAFDKEYENLSDPECQPYRLKLIEKCAKYRGLAIFYYIFDEHNLLHKKDSPYDRGIDVFNELYRKRIKIR